jgi:uncharacterized protein YkwD
LLLSRSALAIALTLAFTASADACGRCRSARGVRFLRDVQSTGYTTVTVIPAYQNGPGYQVPVYPQPQAPAKVTPALAPQAGMVGGDDAATFLVLVNDARARIGRPALAWDATLAAFAATNAAIHMPGSSGGAGQCWAGTRSYRQAFSQWMNSPAHYSILMSATYSVGVSTCPSGTTCNAR